MTISELEATEETFKKQEERIKNLRNMRREVGMLREWFDSLGSDRELPIRNIELFFGYCNGDHATSTCNGGKLVQFTYMDEQQERILAEALEGAFRQMLDIKLAELGAA